MLPNRRPWDQPRAQRRPAVVESPAMPETTLRSACGAFDRSAQVVPRAVHPPLLVAESRQVPEHGCSCVEILVRWRSARSPISSHNMQRLAHSDQVIHVCSYRPTASRSAHLCRVALIRRAAVAEGGHFSGHPRGTSLPMLWHDECTMTTHSPAALRTRFMRGPRALADLRAARGVLGALRVCSHYARLLHGHVPSSARLDTGGPEQSMPACPPRRRWWYTDARSRRSGGSAVARTVKTVDSRLLKSWLPSSPKHPRCRKDLTTGG